MSEIEIRLRRYLERDKEGIRKKLLRVFLDGRKYTTKQIHGILSEDVEINIRGISAMVGLMSSRLGILKTELGEKNKYFLKPEYSELLRSTLEEFEEKNI